MQAYEIQEIGRELKVRRKMRELFDKMREKRQTLSPDTLYRAFSDTNCSSELLEEIRAVGKDLLDNSMMATEGMSAAA